MNFHKNYYKLCLPCLMATAGILILGIALALILGYNTSVATPYGLGGIIFYLGVYLLAVSVFDIIYLKIRYNWSTGFVVVLKNFVDVFLLLAIIAIVRVPLTLETVLSCLVATLWGNFVSLVLLSKANTLLKEEDKSQDLCNKLIAKNIMFVVLCAVSVIAVLLLFLMSYLDNSLSFVLGGVIAVIVSTFTALFIMVPVWLGFVKRELKLKEKSKKIVTEKIENATQINETQN